MTRSRAEPTNSTTSGLRFADTANSISPQMLNASRLITKRELCHIVPYSAQHILRLEKRGKFPRRIQVGANRVAWLLSEVEQWIAARAAERDTFIR